MKRLLLALLICAGGIEFSTHTTQNIETNVATFSSAQELHEAISTTLILGNMTHKQITNTLTEWYQNNTALFSESFCPFQEGPAPLDINPNSDRDSKLATQIFPHIFMTTRDFVLVGVHAYNYFCAHLGSEIAPPMEKDQLDRTTKDLSDRMAMVIQTLDKLKAKQNLSPEQIEIIGRLAAVAMWGANLEANDLQSRIRLLERLAAISNIELPEELKSDWRN